MPNASDFEKLGVFYLGLDRKSVYVANIVPWRPPGERLSQRAGLGGLLQERLFGQLAKG